ncbi:MAG: penicillin-binding transpeptidase domain-containing protein [Lachnospiraceae bacterium]|nr:penicillin-binding transpeptidase domain-containing protein [Lachnospiraceae bacterium]
MSGKISKKLVGLFIMVILALVALAIRITYINATDGEQYSRQVLSQTQQQYDSRTIPFKRGDIIDRNGTILATSEKVYNVILDCKVTNSDVTVKGEKIQRYLEPTIAALVKVLGLDETELRGILESEDTKGSQYQILKKQISITEKKAFEDYLDLESDANKNLSSEEKLERKYVKGVWFEEDYKRVYPMNSMASDTIGFTYSGNSADWGIEGYYSSVLNGVNGRQFGYFNSDADVEQTIIEAQDGNNVVSTIDVNIQQIIRNALTNFQSKASNGPNGAKAAQNAAVVVMNPNNGEILGMDSLDWYDLNNPKDLTPFYTAEEIEAMDEQTQLNNLFSIWRNYAVTDAYEPGSTFKPMTVATALQTNSVSTGDTFYCDGFGTVSGIQIKCSAYSTGGHGEESLGDVLRNSCNDGIMQIVDNVGTEEFLKYQDIFNFGSYTGIDLPGESTGILHTLDAMGPTELATAGFGQGFTCTMMQEISAFASVINGGNYYKPHVVNAVTDSSGNVIENIDSTLVRQTVSQEVSDTIRGYLGTVMTPGGTGEAAAVAGYSMGGKTGTAEKVPRGTGKYLVSFIGFAPLDNPQVVVYVLIDEPNEVNQDNDSYRMEIAQQIFKELMPYMNIFPTDPSAVEKEAPVDATAAQTEAVSNENAPAPPADESATAGDAVEGSNNDLLSDGITNSDAAITNQ